MTQNPANLLMGPAQVYVGAFQAIEPTDANVNTTPAASAWTEVGLTDGGVMMTIAPKFTDFSADQIVDVPGTRLTSRTITVTTTMAEVTLANLANALNSTIGATGAGFATFEPNFGQFASQLPYAAIILDGWAPGPVNSNFRRRIILRKTMQTSKVDLNYAKDKQTGLACTWQAYYVSNTVAPYHIVDQQS
ncbi:hypothetical protein AB0383_20620 [Amycolatopsis sp. NPDC051373]|uniref:hypothetical protein n=1 Tax=Amycolatopsis sp. NPDC051373 TaxID=3155801 RepID=UPI0034500AA7